MSGEPVKPRAHVPSGPRPVVLEVHIFSRTDVGKVRSDNEDSYLVVDPSDPRVLAYRGRMALVADGMGGAVGGATASRMVAETIRDTYYDDFKAAIPVALKNAVEVANATIHEYARQNPEYRGMGSTCTALVIQSNLAYVAHVGDTRTYLIRDHRILQLTDDHSKVARMVSEGLLTEEEAENHPERNVILRSLGPKPSVEVDVLPQPVEVREGDRLVLCTDGLTGHVTDPEILEIVERHDPQEAAKMLIRLANERGGDDNITVHVIHVGEKAWTTRERKPSRVPPTVDGDSADWPSSAKRNLVPAAVGALVGLVIGVIALVVIGLSGEEPTVDAGGDVQLDAEPESVSLSLTVTPLGSHVTHSDDVVVTCGENPCVIVLPAGSEPIEVVVSHDGHENKPLTITPNEDRAVTVTLDQLRITVNLQVDPTDSQVTRADTEEEVCNESPCIIELVYNTEPIEFIISHDDCDEERRSIAPHQRQDLDVVLNCEPDDDDQRHDQAVEVSPQDTDPEGEGSVEQIADPEAEGSVGQDADQVAEPPEEGTGNATFTDPRGL